MSFDMFSIDTALGTLDSRYWAIKRGRPMRIVAEEIGISEGTLRNFVQGGAVTTTTLRKIEAWCNAQEENVHAD